jgi:hypothetical protein
VKWILSLVLAATTALAADGPRIFYSMERPGAAREYVQISVERNGLAVYRETIDDPDDEPFALQLRPEEVDAVFDLAKELKFFSEPLESNLKVADMGAKTFRWENGDERNEQKFNFSKDINARILADWFSRMTEAQNHLVHLERTVQFDKLSVNKVLLQLQVTMEKNRLVAGDQFLPLLDKVANNESYLNMARERAAKLAQAIRAASGGSGTR